MKIKKSVLERMVKEELGLHIGRMLEKHSVEDAQQNKKGKEKQGGKGEDRQLEPLEKVPHDKAKKPEGDPKGKGLQDPGDHKPAKGSPPSNRPDEDPSVEEPADAAPEKDAPEDKTDIDAEKSKIGNELAGKTVQSVSVEPKSKILPGASEIVLTFKETTDPLKILVTQSGGVKFWYKNQLHNEL